MSMTGDLLFLVLIWFVLAQGSRDKGESFWCPSTISITIGLGVFALIGFFIPSKESSTEQQSIKVGILMLLGASFGLVYCMFFNDKIKERKQYPLMTGIAAVLISTGWFLILCGVCRWLNTIL
jgi:drug/metabolite transporter (DMT)-like permease